MQRSVIGLLPQGLPALSVPDVSISDCISLASGALALALVSIAEMKGPVKDYLKRYGLFSKLGVDNFFPTIGQAVDDYLFRHHVIWRDWEDDSKSK